AGSPGPSCAGGPAVERLPLGRSQRRRGADSDRRSDEAGGAEGTPVARAAAARPGVSQCTGGSPGASSGITAAAGEAPMKRCSFVSFVSFVTFVSLILSLAIAPTAA